MAQLVSVLFCVLLLLALKDSFTAKSSAVSDCFFCLFHFLSLVSSSFIPLVMSLDVLPPAAVYPVSLALLSLCTPDHHVSLVLLSHGNHAMSLIR